MAAEKLSPNMQGTLKAAEADIDRDGGDGEIGDIAETCETFLTQLPSSVSIDLAVVAGVLLAHPQRGVGADALLRLGSAAHQMFHLLEETKDDDVEPNGQCSLCDAEDEVLD